MGLFVANGGRPGPLLLLLFAAGAALAHQSYWLYLLVNDPDPALAAAQRAFDAELRGEDSAASWSRARQLAPRSAFIGVHTALAEERRGQTAAAERILLETERLNSLWLPRWSLASFYLRNRRPAEAARWGRLALDRSHAQVRPALFSLLEQAGVPPAVWLSWCGSRPDVLSSALDYLAAETDRAPDLAAATRILASLEPGSVPGLWRSSLLTACSRLILAGQGGAASQAWNSLAARRMVGGQQVSGRNRIGNPAFADPIDGEAFNWRYRALPGVSRTFDPQSRSVRIRIDGSQPEACTLLSTPVWIPPGCRHRFSCRYRVEGFETAASGPVWTLAQASSEPLLPTAPNSSSEWRRLSFDIPAAGSGSVSSLSLTLVRRRGFIRASGSVEIREPVLETLP